MRVISTSLSGGPPNGINRPQFGSAKGSVAQITQLVMLDCLSSSFRIMYEPRLSNGLTRLSPGASQLVLSTVAACDFPSSRLIPANGFEPEWQPGPHFALKMTCTSFDRLTGV